MTLPDVNPLLTDALIIEAVAKGVRLSKVLVTGLVDAVPATLLGP